MYENLIFALRQYEKLLRAKQSYSAGENREGIKAAIVGELSLRAMPLGRQAEVRGFRHLDCSISGSAGISDLEFHFSDGKGNSYLKCLNIRKVVRRINITLSASDEVDILNGVQRHLLQNFLLDAMPRPTRIG